MTSAATATCEPSMSSASAEHPRRSDGQDDDGDDGAYRVGDLALARPDVRRVVGFELALALGMHRTGTMVRMVAVRNLPTGHARS